MAADLDELLAAASRADIAVYAEHETGCPEWYAVHAPDNRATQGKPCDCGLAQQIADVEALSTFVRVLLSAEPYGIDCVIDMTGKRNEKWAADARRVAADLLRAADAAQPGRGKP